MHVNWQTLTMKFKLRGEWVTLQGEPRLCRSLISLRSIRKVLRKEKEWLLVELSNRNEQKQEEWKEEPIPILIQELLKKI